MLPLQVRVDYGVMTMKGFSAFPKAPALQEPRHQMEFSVMSQTFIWGSHTHPQRCSRYIQQSKPTEPFFKLKHSFKIYSFFLFFFLSFFSFFLSFFLSRGGGESPRGVAANALGKRDWILVVPCIHFWINTLGKGMNHLIPLVMG